MKKHQRYANLVLLPAAFVLLLIMIAGCGGNGAEKQPPISGSPSADLRASQHVEGEQKEGEAGRTLFDRLGGEKTITALVDDMTERVIADPRVNFERRNVESTWLGRDYEPWKPTPENVQQFKERMINFLSLAAGGPVEYSGGDMRTVHEDMRITNNEFDAMVGDIKASMDRLGIGAREQRDLLAIVETTRKQIVEKP